MKTPAAPHPMHRHTQRGRLATTPGQIPLPGWQDIFWRVIANIRTDRLTLIAAGVTFYLLLALFPALGALVALYGLFADPASINEVVVSLRGVFPREAISLIQTQLKSLLATDSSSLGLSFFFGLALALWSVNNGILAVLDGLNVAYGENEERGWLALYGRGFLFTLGGILMLVVYLGLIALAPRLISYAGFGNATESLLNLTRWPVLMGVSIAAVSILYRHGPSRAPAKWRWVSVGSVFTTCVWLLTSMGVSWYLADFAGYDRTYGSLGAIIGLMFWLWVSTCILLIGAEINGEIEHQTVRDSTTGAPRSMGQRGAHVADTVGKAATNDLAPQRLP